MHYHFATKADLLVAAFVKLVEGRCASIEKAAVPLDRCGDAADRARRAVLVLWRETICPPGRAVVELIAASRNDEQLRKALLACDPLVRPTRDQSWARLFGPDILALPGFKSMARLLSVALWGAALVVDTLSKADAARLAEELQESVVVQLGLTSEVQVSGAH